MQLGQFLGREASGMNLWHKGRHRHEPASPFPDLVKHDQTGVEKICCAKQYAKHCNGIVLEGTNAPVPDSDPLDQCTALCKFL